MRRVLITLILALPALAQSPAEFGRFSGGQLNLISKGPTQYSGSFQLTRGAYRGFGGSLGGTLVKDKAWFFASGDQIKPAFTPAFNANLIAIPNSRQTINTTVAPSFLSLRSNTALSSNSFLTVSVSTQR
jgi:hypothetical protein